MIDPQETLELIADGLTLCDDMPDAGADFAESVRDKLESIAKWIDEHNTVTQAQARSVENMVAGLRRWFHE